jgi:peptidoglycan/LPS O-acetylase OafA/YrhL
VSTDVVLSPRHRIYGLDVLRACAILCVVYSHGSHLVRNFIPASLYQIPSLDGVSMFFVLSGFLIGGILIETLHRTEFSMRDLLGFWVRRWFRTVPNYFLVLSLLIAASFLASGVAPLSLADAVRHYLFLQDFNTTDPGFYPEAWSLCVEEWFYVLVPMALFVSTRQRVVGRRQVVLAWIVFVIVAVQAFRIWRISRYGYSDLDAWDRGLKRQVVTRLDSLMFGFLGAYLSRYHRSLWERLARPSVVILGVALLVYPQIHERLFGGYLFYLKYFSFTVASLGTLLLLPRLSALRTGSGRVFRALTLISLISYSMYLLNLTPINLGLLPPVMARLDGWFHWADGGFANSVASYVFYWGLSIGFSFVLFRCFERPFMNLRDRLHGAR